MALSGPPRCFCLPPFPVAPAKPGSSPDNRAIAKRALTPYTRRYVRGISVHRTALSCIRLGRFQAAAVCYPIFYPIRRARDLTLLPM